MNHRLYLPNPLRAIGQALALALGLGIATTACGFGGDTWSEEVQLHDGQKIIVKRSQSYGGRREPAKPPPIKEHSISFTLPASGKSVKWTSEFGEDVGRANFKLLAVHVKDGTPYVVAEPNLCLSYNKWGRPNPPYVFFKHDGKQWQRIAIEQLPGEFKTINVALTLNAVDVEEMSRKRLVPAWDIKDRNLRLSQPEYRSILREAIPNAGGERCSEMIGNGKGKWLGTGWFSEKPSLDACLNYCLQENFGTQFCPCNSLFKGK